MKKNYRGMTYEIVDFNGEEAITITGYERYESYTGQEILVDLVVPGQIDNIPVRIIGKEAFKASYNLKSVILPEGIQIISDDAFSYCHRLKSINFPESLSSVGNFAFYSTGLTKIVFKTNLSYFGEFSFAECIDLVSIVFRQATIMTFCQNAFNNCKKLNAVYIKSIEHWCNSIFYNINSNPLSNDNVWLYENGSSVISIQGNVNKLCFVKCRAHKMILDSVKARKDSFLGLKVDFLVIPNPVEIKLTDFSEPAFTSIRELEIINENNEYDTYVLPEYSNEIVESLIKW